jgi:hypothetical protein
MATMPVERAKTQPSRIDEMVWDFASQIEARLYHRGIVRVVGKFAAGQPPFATDTPRG